MKRGGTMQQDTGFGVLTGNNIEARTFKAGSIIFREGDEASELFVIKSGQVLVQIGNRTIRELGAESIFGEMALIDFSSRSAAVVAITDAEVVPVSEKQCLCRDSQTP